jgi:pimeloyl-ACP methyl ester carboxylesterase
MASAAANGIQIEYEEFGDPGNPAIVLIMGFAAQMYVWPDSFCRALADRSFRVVRFDNRDAGLSTHLDGVKAPGMKRSMFASIFGIKLKVPYTLGDMALDTVGLLDALNIERAHVVGASMGGMIAQILAARHGGRIASLTSLMSTSGSRRLPGPRPRVLKHVLFKHRKKMQEEDMIRYLVDFWTLIASPKYPTPAAEILGKVTSWVRRDSDPNANIRQFAAMAADGDRTELLGTIECPALVIHGAHDPLIRVEGGQHTADCIRNAELHVVDGMGHEIPEQLVPLIAERIAQHCGAMR